RLEERQRAAGEAALAAVQRYLGDYLSNLPAGVALDRARFEERLTAASNLVQRDVNLYWGGNLIYASSKEEPFTAGLLPQRLPGEVYRSRALAGEERKSRATVAGGAPSPELSPPLQREARLSLSVPLLAQQEEAARQLVQLRRQGLVITILLFALAAA